MNKPKDILLQRPGNQQVLDSWSTGSMGNGGAFDYYLAQEGFIVACVDGRGTGGHLG